MKRLFFPLIFLSFVGCKTQQAWMEPEPSLERMMQQPRIDPYQESSFFDDGIAMRSPPRGTISLERTIGDRLFVDGLEGGRYATTIPTPLTHAMLDRGRDRFEIICGACHGVDGSGESVVAQNMSLRKPPSLHEDRIRSLPPGRLYQVVREGYGLMPPYETQLSVADRWAVVAYVRALQWSRHIDVAALAPDVRRRLEAGEVAP